MEPKYSDDWIEDCMHWYKKVLTGEKGHWCPEFDDLPIDETCPEFEFCRCDLSESEEESNPTPAER